MNRLLAFFRKLSVIQRSIVSAVLGFAVYGGWGVLVNFMHGEDLALRAGLTQGSYSFVLTFFMTLLLESSYKRSDALFGGGRSAIAATVVFSCALVFTGSWLVNYVSGTPEIFKTVILGYVLGGAYSLIYTIGLAREHASSSR